MKNTLWSRRSAVGTVALVCLMGAASIDTAAASDTISAGGAGSGLGLGLVKALGERFHAESRHPAVAIVPSLGSSGGIRAVVAGAIDVAVSGRPPRDDEAKLALEMIRVGRTPIVFVSKAGGGAIAIAADDLAAIYNLSRTAWPDGRPLRIILRPKDELNFKLIEAYHPGLAALFEKARALRTIPVAQTDQDTLDLAQSIDGSFAVTALSGVLAERRSVVVATLDGVAPSVETLRAGTYPLHRPIFLVIRKDARPNVAAFLRFAVGAEGRALVETLGVLPGES